MAKRRAAQTKPHAVKELLGALTQAERPAEQEGATAQAKAGEPAAGHETRRDQSPVVQPPAGPEERPTRETPDSGAEDTSLGALPPEPGRQTPNAGPKPVAETAEAEPVLLSMSDARPREQLINQSSGCEQQSRSDSRLNLRSRIQDVLKDKDRMDRAELCAELNAPLAEFNQTIIQMQEKGELRNEEVGAQTLLYIPLTPDKEKRFVELVAVIKRADKTHEEALEEIRTDRLYKMMYRSWPDFLHHVMDMSVDQWKDYRTGRSVKKIMEENGIKNKCSQSALLEFAPLRKCPEAFVEALKEFQGLPETKWTVQAAKGIAKRHLAVADDLERLRRTVPDCTREEAVDLRFLRERWDKEVIEPVQRVMGEARRNWSKDLAAKVQGLVQAGKPESESLLAVCKESRACPSDEGLLRTVRGDDLDRVVHGIRLLVNREWLPAFQREEVRKKLERDAKSLGLAIYDPSQPPPLPPTPSATAEGAEARPSALAPATESAPPKPPEEGEEREEEEDYPDGLDLDNSLIVWAESNVGEPYDPPYLLGIARDAVLIAGHRVQTNNAWDAGVLKKEALAIREALEPFLKEPAAEAAGEEPPAEQS
jgi:hypothetical protein